MNVLVIGGAGFIGSHLCEEYIKANNVVSIDNYISGTKDNHIDKVEYLNMDAKDILSLDREFDLIFHLGEYSRVEQSLKKIDFVLENNSSPILNVLKFAKRSNAKLIYAGSSTKFADNGMNKFKSPYSFSKWQNTELVRFYCELNKITYAITYFYNVYGGRENYQGEFATVIAKFLNRKELGQNLEVTLPGTQRRNFTHINDTIKALKLIAEDGEGDEFGIAHHESFSVIEVAKLISDNITFINESPANRLNSELITDKILALGWKPTYSLEEYIKSK